MTEPISLGFEGTLSCTGVHVRALPERMSARRFKLVDELTGEVVSWLAQFDSEHERERAIAAVCYAWAQGTDPRPGSHFRA